MAHVDDVVMCINSICCQEFWRRILVMEIPRERANILHDTSNICKLPRKSLGGLSVEWWSRPKCGQRLLEYAPGPLAEFWTVVLGYIGGNVASVSL